jgi:hypothetical protein
MAIKTVPGAARPQILGSNSSSATTNATSEANLLAVLVPGGLLGTNGRIRVTGHYKGTGTAGTKNIRVRHSTSSGDTSAGTLLVNIAGSATTLSGILAERGFTNNNSASAQICADAAIVGVGGATTTVTTGTINTANDSWINLNAFVGNAGDTLGYVFYTVEFIPSV